MKKITSFYYGPVLTEMLLSAVPFYSLIDSLFMPISMDF